MLSCFRLGVAVRIWRLVLVLFGVVLISLGISVASMPSIARIEKSFTMEFTRNITVEPMSSLYLWIPPEMVVQISVL